MTDFHVEGLPFAHADEIRAEMSELEADAIRRTTATGEQRPGIAMYPSHKRRTNTRKD